MHLDLCYLKNTICTAYDMQLSWALKNFPYKLWLWVSSFLQKYGYHFSQMCRIIIQTFSYVDGLMRSISGGIGGIFSYILPFVGRIVGQISVNMGGIMDPNFESEWHVTVVTV